MFFKCLMGFMRTLSRTGKCNKKFCFTRIEPEMQKNKIIVPEQSDNRQEAAGHSE